MSGTLVEWTYHKTADGQHPNGDEQQQMWLMNRARVNPPQEGVWLATMDDPFVSNARDYFNVDLALLQSEFTGYSPKPPAAFDVRLYNAARVHSEDLIARDAQDHDQQFDRISEAGFYYWNARGNVFSFTKTGLYGHAAFNIDWGFDESGMQPGRGHRQAIMSLDGDYTNVGIAAVTDNDPLTSVGPLVVTGNFCYANENYSDHYNRFIVGTVWEDLNSNDQYDSGEGVGGVSVMPELGTYFAVTSASGSYAIPATAGGTYRVIFSGSSLPYLIENTVTLAVESVLLDIVIGVDLLIQKGDVNGDGDVDLQDIIVGLRISAGLPVDIPLQLNADVNQDDRISIPEVIYGLQKLSAGGG